MLLLNIMNSTKTITNTITGDRINAISALSYVGRRVISPATWQLAMMNSKNTII